MVDTVTTTTSSTYHFSTQSYILTLNSASQTEIDALSAGEIILRQFQADFPHIKKLHKRTDNAGNFSSHSTPAAERVSCQKLSLLYIISMFITCVLYCVIKLVLTYCLGTIVKYKKIRTYVIAYVE